MKENNNNNSRDFVDPERRDEIEWEKESLLVPDLTLPYGTYKLFHHARCVSGEKNQGC